MARSRSSAALGVRVLSGGPPFKSAANQHPSAAIRVFLTSRRESRVLAAGPPVLDDPLPFERGKRSTRPGP